LSSGLDDLYRKGYRLYKKRRYGEAADLLRKALELDQEDVDTRIALAGCLQGMGRHTEAAEMMKETVYLDPADPLIRYNLAYFLACMGRISEAREEAARCLQCECTQELREKARRLTAVLGELKPDEGLPFEKEVRCYELFKEAQRLLYGQRYREAIRIYEQILELKPSHAASINNIGLCQLSLGDSREALNIFRRAAQLDRYDALSLMNIANILQKQGDNKQAEEHIQKALKLVTPTITFRDLLRIAILLIEMRRYGEGEKFLRESLKKRDGDIQLTFLLGVTMARQGEFKEALEAWKKIADRCQEARQYMERAEAVIRGETALEQTSFKPKLVANTTEWE